MGKHFLHVEVAFDNTQTNAGNISGKKYNHLLTRNHRKVLLITHADRVGIGGGSYWAGRAAARPLF